MTVKAEDRMRYSALNLRMELACCHYITVYTSLLVRHQKQMLQICRSFSQTLALQLKTTVSDFLLPCTTNCHFPLTALSYCL